MVAAVITEPVQGAGGVFPPPDGYLAELRRLCDHHGALLVFDEVITGFGRLGTWFAADHYGVVPDLTTFAKAVTSGYQPLGGVFVGERVRRAAGVRPGLHPAPRLHVLGPSGGVRGRPGQPGDHGARGARRAGRRRRQAARRRAAGAGRRRHDRPTPGATARCGRPGCAPTRTPSRSATGWPSAA